MLAFGVRSGADVTVPAKVGPVAQDLQVEVVRGNEVTIRLQGSAKGVSVPLEYSVFEFPKNGTLGAVVVRERERFATVTYRSDPGSLAAVDTFTYRSRVPAGRFSAPAKVTIRIAEPVARLRVQEVLDFGLVPLLGQAVGSLEVANMGTGTFDGNVLAPPPFRVIDESPRLVIPPGESTRIALALAPGERLGKFEERLVLQLDNPLGSAVLKGKSFAPFRVGSDRAKLELGDDSGRSAQIRIDNPGDQAISLTVSAPERLRLDRSPISLPTGGTHLLEVRLPPADVAEFVGAITLKAPFHSIEITTLADAAPAQVEIVEPIAPDLRFDGDYGKALEGKIVVRNTGGEVAFISARVNPPFVIAEGRGGIELKPGGTLTYNISLDPPHVGMIEEVLKLEGAGNPIEFPLRGLITLPPGMESAPTAPRGPDRPPAPEGERKELRLSVRNLVVGVPEAKRKSGDYVPVVQRANLISQDGGEISFEWPHPAVGDWGYVVETRVHRVHDETGIPLPAWVEVGSESMTMKIDRVGGRAEVRGLPPGGRYAFRLVTRDKEGNYSAPSKSLVVLTEAAKSSFFGWLRLWMLGVIAVLAVVGILIWRRVQYLRELYG